MIRWLVILSDFIVLNTILFIACHYHAAIAEWPSSIQRLLLLTSNFALMMSEWRFSTIVHYRTIGAGDILRRVMMLVVVWMLLSYLFIKAIFIYHFSIGRHIMYLGVILFLCLLVSRYCERRLITHIRKLGWNTRSVLCVGNDAGLAAVCKLLSDDPARGYHLVGYYADEPMVNPNKGLQEMTRLGTMADFMARTEKDTLEPCDDLYLCISRRERETIRRISRMCDKHVIRFFYVPVSVESLGLSLKHESLEDLEVYTTYEIPLRNPLNQALKRSLDVLASSFFLLCTLLLLPFIFVAIKLQSPGPLLFRQKRTGLDGREFYCYKFRSMHVNKEADKLQATENDPRKFPFGNFMRKSNIDELPQFWNVLKGDMSIVGPRPHMLAHTEQYSQLIDKYMVRHFVKPGVTGWAQVTGFRGETKELWQMEERVKRDIWYIENWSIWLDVRIVWMTIKTIFVHDEKAY